MKDEKYPQPISEVSDDVLVDDHRWCHVFWANIENGKKYNYWTKDRLVKLHGKIVRELFRRGFKHNYHKNSIDETLPKELKKKSIASIRDIMRINILKKIGEVFEQ